MTTTRTQPTEAAPAAPEGKRAFRTDVQALRAVAVMAVVLYHLWPERLPGGFAARSRLLARDAVLGAGTERTGMLRTGRRSM